MSTVILLLLSLLHYVYGQTHHCINELEAITPNPLHLNLSNPSKIHPNYSTATSVAYHYGTSTILIAGDFFYIDPKDTTNKTYYQYFQAFNHTKDNKFEMKYSKYYPFKNPKFGNKFISHESLRSWTRIIAHPSLNYTFLLGINNLTAYNVTNGQLIWTATIPPCSNNERPIIYNDATFFKGGNIMMTHFLNFCEYESESYL